MSKVCLRFTTKTTEYGLVAETGLGMPMNVKSLIMPEGYLPDIIAPDGGLFKVVPGKLQKYIVPEIGDIVVFLTLIVDEGVMRGRSIDVRNEQIYMTKATAQQYKMW